MVASHTAVPLGTAKWLVRGLPPIISACPWVGDKVCVCPLPTGKVSGVGVDLTSHFAAPKRDSCMAGYLCPMPIGILFANSLTASFPW